MSTQPSSLSGTSLVAWFGQEWRNMVKAAWKRDEELVIPAHWYRLTDIRPANREEGEALARGLAPVRAGLGNFDPVKGPFHVPASFNTAWAVSFEFLRDLSTLEDHFVPIVETWLPHWFENHPNATPNALSRLTLDMVGLSNNEHIICRGRRVLNWLAHLLPISHQLTPASQARIWAFFLADVRCLCSDGRGFLSQLRSAFVPTNRRVLWMRACAILGVQACAPGMLAQDVVDGAVGCIDELICPDGMFADGSILGTLSATADLAMLTKIEAIEPIFQRAAQAIATLTRGDGSLVTFGNQHGFRGLVEAILGSHDWRRSTILKTGSIGFLEIGDLRIWTRGCSSPGYHGPLIEVEWQGQILFTTGDEYGSALRFDCPAHLSKPQCRRRDEDDNVTLEVSCRVDVAGQHYTCIRTITVSADHNLIKVQDLLFPEAGGGIPQRVYGYFLLGQNCQTVICKDGQSALIQLPSGVTWRLRTCSLQIIAEGLSNYSKGGISQHLLMCLLGDQSSRREIDMRWELQLEDKA
ncbi:hypothetical protein [Candidatus Phycosocius spiralis]|uniref:Heparinase n=1 Tax=Candidatus Phycosocius spiralis TaxID=2815099 RepID=A0ABQ4PUU8_9PROT|nr:hypothetical protein [Candidatus Phycosocius spiralis]GIU66787.1 hypothetical protein PsB1_0941 [Candidatus Phycosocius spiralis]